MGDLQENWRYTRAHISKSISGEPASFEYDYGAMSMRSPIHTLFRSHTPCLHVLSSRLVRTSHRLEAPPKWLPQPHVTDLEDPGVGGWEKKDPTRTSQLHSRVYAVRGVA